jgi:bacterial/archaeal transporter family protein
MQNWLVYTLMATAVYGFWGFFPKLASDYLDPKSALVYQTLGSIVGTLVILATVRFRLPVQVRGITFSVLTGISGVVGTLFLLVALSKGKASLVIPVTALYPIGTILLAMLILKETLTVRQVAGMVLSFVAIFLLAG